MKKYPVYVAHGLGIRKIEDEETYIEVNNDLWESGIMRFYKVHQVVDTLLKNGTKVSEVVFNNAYQTALTKLNLMLLDEMVPEGKALTPKEQAEIF